MYISHTHTQIEANIMIYCMWALLLMLWQYWGYLPHITLFQTLSRPYFKKSKTLSWNILLNQTCEVKKFSHILPRVNSNFMVLLRWILMCIQSIGIDYILKEKRCHLWWLIYVICSKQSKFGQINLAKKKFQSS